jgi:hypothetical protein
MRGRGAVGLLEERAVLRGGPTARAAGREVRASVG